MRHLGPKTYAISGFVKRGLVVGYRLTGDKLYTTNAPRGHDDLPRVPAGGHQQIVEAPDQVHRPRKSGSSGAFVVDTQTRGCRCTRLPVFGRARYL